ncbi:hypothetical protein SeMB42_g06521 [Synchytrium endobioticum]|uniref:Uncharacterized protein n=1 Tax=Synchytrium endobioticum TaxID=286115 RepID=A0A507CHL7_9FUNG|nr:hypothetical protein SeMB42_g06521 [Synchytrium endobioticum]
MTHLIDGFRTLKRCPDCDGTVEPFTSRPSSRPWKRAQGAYERVRGLLGCTNPNYVVIFKAQTLCPSAPGGNTTNDDLARLRPGVLTVTTLPVATLEGTSVMPTGVCNNEKECMSRVVCCDWALGSVNKAVVDDR